LIDRSGGGDEWTIASLTELIDFIKRRRAARHEPGSERAHPARSGENAV
jgi:hypothetical protein